MRRGKRVVRAGAGFRPDEHCVGWSLVILYQAASAADLRSAAKRGSSVCVLLGWVKEDAAYIAEQIRKRAKAATAAHGRGGRFLTAARR